LPIMRRKLRNTRRKAKRSDAAAEYANQIGVLQKHLEIAKSLKPGQASSR
jgi:hypothetical protein